MKRLSAIVICILLMLSMITVSVSAAETDSVLKLPEDDGTGYPVTGISGDSYKNNDDVTKLVVPENILRLGEGVFIGCSNLDQIKLHDKIQVIGEGAFERTAYYDDKGNWKDGVLYIGDALIKADPEKIAETYSIRKGTRIIADGAFRDCKKLNSVTVPDTVEYVGTNAFVGTTYFENQENWSNNTLILDYLLLAVNKEYTGTFTVPNGIRTIADSAFKHAKLTELITPDSLKHIGYNAFWDCQELKTVNLGKFVETLGRGPFRMCTELSEILVHEESEFFAVVDGVLYNNQLSSVIRCPHKLSGKVELPHSVKKINAYAFEWCTEVESVDIPEGCVFVGNSAFSVCENLSDVVLPANMEYIDQYAFSYCNSIESISIPDNVYYLGKYAFTCCMDLKEVEIGNGLTNLREGLFESAEKLNTVNLGENIEEISDSAFRFTKYITNVSKYRNGLLIASDKYLIKVDQDVKNCAIPSGVTIIADGAFEQLSEGGCIKEIHVPSSIEKFNWGAFVDVPKKVPVYYDGSWSNFVSTTEFDADCINLHTTDFKTTLWSVVALSGAFIVFTLSVLAFNHLKKRDNQERETDDDEYFEEITSEVYDDNKIYEKESRNKLDMINSSEYFSEEVLKSIDTFEISGEDFLLDSPENAILRFDLKHQEGTTTVNGYFTHTFVEEQAAWILRKKSVLNETFKNIDLKATSDTDIGVKFIEEGTFSVKLDNKTFDTSENYNEVRNYMLGFMNAIIIIQNTESY